ncbi:MAG: hypothetical protein ACHQ2Y_06595 [Candidatus Lutacidiplasmatales archaeon]
MAAPETAPLGQRVAELERQLRELRLRLAELELLVSPRRDNPADKTAIREKVVYDWQG